MTGFWIFMLLMNLLVPAVMILFGRIFMKKPPKEINAAYGYRTRMSMKNKDTWEFAHHYFGKIWYQWGCVLLPASIAVMLPVLGKNEDTVGSLGAAVSFVQILFLIGAIYPTEKALKSVFDKEGKRKKE